MRGIIGNWSTGFEVGLGEEMAEWLRSGREQRLLAAVSAGRVFISRDPSGYVPRVDTKNRGLVVLHFETPKERLRIVQAGLPRFGSHEVEFKVMGPSLCADIPAAHLLPVFNSAKRPTSDGELAMASRDKALRDASAQRAAAASMSRL